MDRRAIARELRRRLAQEALEGERDREQMLEEHLHELVGEREARAVDEEAFATMAPEDVEIVREMLDPPELGPGSDELSFDLAEGEDDDETLEELTAAELERLQEELADSRRRQGAWQRYLEALDRD